jgi:hypothetical protein
MRFFIMMLMAFFARVRPVFHHGKSGLHEEDQGGRDDQPDGIESGLDLIVCEIFCECPHRRYQKQYSEKHQETTFVIHNFLPL